jgi:hypothetical protein
MAAGSEDDWKVDEFTVEVCFQLRSIQNSAAVRTLAARWNGDKKVPGWSFGITGTGSRRKPQTLVMQLFGTTPDAAVAEAALFSDQTIRLDTPYFASVSVTPATSESTGRAVFHLKDLSNDDEPLASVTVEHAVTGGLQNDLPLTIGGRSGADMHEFDGMLDDVRLSASALTADELLLASDAPRTDSLGFWRFEPLPGLLEDSTAYGRRLRTTVTEQPALEPSAAALADLCHVLLNSSEFLYVK